MSRSELHNWECAIERLSGDNADKMLAIAQDIYNTAFVRGKNYMSLEQQPCEDCISRQAAIDAAVQSLMDWDGMFMQEANCRISDAINDLPPVTSQPKKGHWIADVDRWGDIVTSVNGYRCSDCNSFNTDRDNFCPNCGARMEVSE